MAPRLLQRLLLQRPQQDPEHSGLLEQVLRRVDQLLQAPNGLQELSALLPVVLFQDLPLLRQRALLSLLVLAVQPQAPVVAPQLRQLLGEKVAGAAQRPDLAPQRLELGPGGRALCLAPGCGLVGVVHGARVAQDEAQQTGQRDGLVVGKLDGKVFPGRRRDALLQDVGS